MSVIPLDTVRMKMLSLETPVEFSKDGPLAVELHNFWPPEESFAWSAGRWSEIGFDMSLEALTKDQCELVLDLDVYKHPPELEGQNVFIYLNGLRIGSRLISKRVTVFLDFSPKILKKTNNALTIDTPDSAKPSQFSGTDSRLLGVQLFTFQIRNFTDM